MSTGSLSRLQTAVLVLVYGFLAFASATYLTPKLLKMKASPSQSEGFDFNLILDNENVGTGPAVGERIDLENLKGPDGKSLANTIDEYPAVIVAVSPGCAMCRISADEMTQIRTRLKTVGVEYYVVSFATSSNPIAFFEFADSLNTGAPAFVRSISEVTPPDRFTAMLVPSHFLVDSSGKVIKKWPGSNNAELIRQRMANQILTDTLNTLSELTPRK